HKQLLHLRIKLHIIFSLLNLKEHFTVSRAQLFVITIFTSLSNEPRNKLSIGFFDQTFRLLQFVLQLCIKSTGVFTAVLLTIKFKRPDFRVTVTNSGEGIEVVEQSVLYLRQSNRFFRQESFDRFLTQINGILDSTEIDLRNIPRIKVAFVNLGKLITVKLLPILLSKIGGINQMYRCFILHLFENLGGDLLLQLLSAFKKSPC